jgi:hypothetical protein
MLVTKAKSKAVYGLIPFIRHSGKSKTLRTENNLWLAGLEGSRRD